MLKPCPVSTTGTGATPGRIRDGDTETSAGTGFDTVTSEVSAWKILTRGTVTPPPKNSRLSVIGRPVVRSASRMVPTLAPGSACRMIAHVPVTCGAAIEVPLSDWKPPPGADEVIESPGANSDMNVATFENTETLLLLSIE